VRYFDSRGAYYCQWQGRQHRLATGPNDAPTGPTYLEALEAFKRLMQMGAAGEAGNRNTVRVVLETYLQHIEGKRKPGTLNVRVKCFRPFVAVHGELPVGELKHFDVYKFIDEMRRPRWNEKAHTTCKWGDSRVVTFIDSLHAAFNWAVKSGLIGRNPLIDIEKPRSRSRSRECLATPEQHRGVLRVCHPRLKELVTCLENVGCRPGELINATAADWDDSLGALVYYGDDRRRDDEFAHKTSREKRDRVIYFTGEALEIMRRLVRHRGTGPLFLTRQGNPWTIQRVCDAFKGLRKRLGLPNFTAYSYRHSFCTNWLKSGRSIEVLAELMGNSAATIRKHYSHLCMDRDLRRQVEEFKREVESERRASGH
jgi:integrase